MKKVEFDLEKAKAGAKLITRDGKPARLICWDRLGATYCILALVKYVEAEREEMFSYTIDGKFQLDADVTRHDLFILEEPTIRPYANAEEVLKDMKEHGSMIREKNEEHYCAIVHINDRGVQIDSEYCYSFEQLNAFYCWQDGHPCGVEEGGNNE